MSNPRVVHNRQAHGARQLAAIAAGALTLCLGVQPVAAQSLLLREPTRSRPAAPVDPALPTGPLRDWAPRSARAGAATLCSTRFPLCVAAQAPSEPSALHKALPALEQAYEALVVALALPPPLGSGTGYREPLVLRLTSDEAPLRTRVWPSWESRGFDAGHADCSVGAGAVHSWPRTACLCLGEGIAARLDPALPPHLRRAYATYLWWVIGAPVAEDLEAITRFGLAPERAPFATALERTSEGSGLLFEYLEQRWGGSAPAELATAMLARAGNHTSAAAARWNNEPDLPDILRASLDASSDPWPLWLGQWQLSRRLLGEAPIPDPWAPLAWAAAWLQPRDDWTLPTSSLPRRVLLTRPVEPTGAVSLALVFDRAWPAAATLGFRADCEGPVAFKWQAARLYGDGRPASVVDMAWQEQSQVVERQLVELQDVRSLLFVGVNLGAISARYPFDPDIVPFEPHSCTVYLTEVP